MSTLTQSRPFTPRDIGLLALFLVVVIGVGTGIGLLTLPGEWYDALQKPFFTPPNWIFGPVWTALYVLIAIAGWRTFRVDPGSTPMRLWFVQMGLNWLWSPIWFGLHWTWVAFAVIAAILIAVVAFIVTSWNRDRLAALCFVPYAAWVGFASLLNLSIAVLN